MADDVEHGGPDPDAPDAQPDGRDAHVLDRGVGEEAFVVVGAAQEQRADHQRQHADEQQHGFHPWEDFGRGEQFVDPQQRQEPGVDQSRGDQRRGRGRGGEVGVDAHGVEREQLGLAAVTAEDQQEGRLQVEGAAARGRGGDGGVVERLAVGGGGQQQDAQVGHGDARRADEDVFPRRFQRLRRAAVVDDARRAERGGFEEDPRHGEVRGEIGSCYGCGQEHQQARVGAGLAQVAVVEAGLRVEEGEGGDDAEQAVEERARGVEGEPHGRGLAVKPSGDDPNGEGRLHGVEGRAREAQQAPAADREGRCRDEDAENEVADHGVSPLRW